LPVINSIDDALKAGAALIHPDLANIQHAVPDVYPEPGTNIANRTKIRKGNMTEGWAKSEVIVEATYHIPQASHAFMETRNATVKITPEGCVRIRTASQGPHASRKLIAESFNLPEGGVMIEAPFVGGGYGGKVAPHPEMMAYIASRAAGGQEGGYR
jgi:CO/xanthine dehydrogenase Mo-binding subunit